MDLLERLEKETLERYVKWAALLLTGEAIIWITVFVGEDVYTRPCTLQQLPFYALNADSVVVHATTAGKAPTGEDIEAGKAFWLGDIVDKEVVCGGLLELLV